MNQDDGENEDELQDYGGHRSLLKAVSCLFDDHTVSHFGDQQAEQHYGEDVEGQNQDAADVCDQFDRDVLPLSEEPDSVDEGHVRAGPTGLVLLGATGHQAEAAGIPVVVWTTA